MIATPDYVSTVERYAPSWRETWDDFVRKSRNGTFLFLRDYMDYHAYRYDDASMMVLPLGGTRALLPAHRDGDTLYSHNGLTYGGFVFDGGMTVRHMLGVFDAALCYLQSVGVRRWLYKSMPYIYHKAPSDEPLVALYLLDAPIVRSCALSVVMPDTRRYEARRLRGIAKAQRCHLYVAMSTDYARMWEMLAGVLPGAPTHTLGEIAMLAMRFPHNIKLWAAYEGDSMIAGVVIYETDRVARAQYIATSDYGKAVGAGDLLMSYLLEMYGNRGLFVDLGTSDSGDGRELSRGILDYKEGWSARTVAYSHYMIDVAAYQPGRLLEALK